MQKLLLAGIGIGAGFGVTLLCWLTGLQNTHFTLLWMINSAAGISSALCTEALLKHRRRQRYLTRSELDQAIGALSERYALKPGHEQVLIALHELKNEVQK
jgi:hypothetical protein